MKIKSLLIIFSLLLIVACGKQGGGEKVKVGNLEYGPENPAQGEYVNFEYTADKSAKEVSAVVYEFNNTLPSAKDIELDKSGNVYSGKFLTGEGFKGAYIKFTTDDAVDRNGGEGYLVEYTDGGDNFNDFNVAVGLAKFNWAGRMLQVDVNADSLVAAVTEELKDDAKLAQNATLYITMLDRVKQRAGKDEILKEVNRIADRDDLSKETIETIISWNSSARAGVKTQKLIDELKELDPQNEYFFKMELKKLEPIMDVDQLLAKADEYLKTYNTFEAKSYLHSSVVGKLYVLKKYDELKEYLEKYPLAANPSFMNRYAWDRFQQNKDLDFAEYLIEKGLKSAEEEHEKLRYKKEYVSKNDYEKNMKYTLAAMYDTYAAILDKRDKYSESLVQYKKAVEISEGENPDVNEGYVRSLLTNRKYDEALDVCRTSIVEGFYTDKSFDLLKDAYANKNGSAAEFDEYKKEVVDELEESIKEELQNSIKKEKAPEFVLKNLREDEVALADFKGKIIVVDFWATWCGPCKASFPAMNEAKMENKDVMFLFVNSWENHDNKIFNARNYIANNGFNTLEVLIDGENKVITDYGVEGIPTKFIIDKDGYIRFKSVGYPGSKDKLKRELKVMFEMI